MKKEKPMTDLAVTEAARPETLPAIADLASEARTLLPAPLERLMEQANLMAASGLMVPKHFRGNPEACLAIAYQAARWEMDAIAVASKAYVANDKIAYEAQLIAALVYTAPDLVGGLEIEFQGIGGQRSCRVVGRIRGHGKPKEYASPIKDQIKPKNSPLWVTDPDQQLSYYSVRAWARRHMPHRLLGIYGRDELVEIRDVTPLSATSAYDDDLVDGPQDTPETEEASWEPSGGAGDAVSDVAGQAPREAGVNEQEPLADDPMVWFEEARAAIEACGHRDQIGVFWRANARNRKALGAVSPPDLVELQKLAQRRDEELMKAETPHDH